MTPRPLAEALLVVKTLGVTEADWCFYEILSAAGRGWPAWRIAQAYKLSPDLIQKLGGPAPEGTKEGAQ